MFATTNFPETEAKKGDGARADMLRECYREALNSFSHNSLVVKKKKEQFQFVTCYALNAIYVLIKIGFYRNTWRDGHFLLWYLKSALKNT